MSATLQLKSTALSVQGGKTNDDAAGFTEHSAWVIDGATGLTDKRQLPGISDAAWLAAEIHEFMQTALPPFDPGAIMTALSDYVLEAFERERDTRLIGQRIELPSTALSFALLQEDTLLLGNIGDCRALVMRPGERLLRFGTSPNEAIEAKLIASLIEKQQGNGKTIGELWQDMLPEIQEPRWRINAPVEEGGYGVVNPTDRWLPHVQFKSLKATPGTRLLLMSDGLERLVDFGKYTYETLFEAAWDKGLTALVEEVRAAEAGDPDCRAYPRLKPMDDASAVLAEIVARPLSSSPASSRP